MNSFYSTNHLKQYFLLSQINLIENNPVNANRISVFPALNWRLQSGICGHISAPVPAKCFMSTSDDWFARAEDGSDSCKAE